LKCILKYWAAK